MGTSKRLAGMALAMALFAGHVVAADVMDGASGFLSAKLYAEMEQIESPSGAAAKRWIAPGVSLGSYDSVMIDKAAFHPEPQPTSQLSSATLKQISTYMDEAFHRELKGVLKVVDKPGPGTLRFRPAITAAAAKNEGLKPYQLLPVAFVLTRGQTSKRAVLAVEYEVQDAATGNVVAAGMREGQGEELESMEDTLTLDKMKPAIDAWAKDARDFMLAAKTAR